MERGPEGAHRIWELHSAACGLHDSLAACRETLQAYLLCSDCSLARVGRKFEVTSSDPCLSVVFHECGGAAGAHAAHVDDTFGCGGPGVLSRVRAYVERRLGDLKAEEKSACMSERERRRSLISQFI